MRMQFAFVWDIKNPRQSYVGGPATYFLPGMCLSFELSFTAAFFGLTVLVAISRPPRYSLFGSPSTLGVPCTG